MSAHKGKPRPTHYKIVCISLYREDIDRLEYLVSMLKGSGYAKVNKSYVIRLALEQTSPAKLLDQLAVRS